MPGALTAHLAELLADADADVRLLACELGRQGGSPAEADDRRLLCGELLQR